MTVTHQPHPNGFRLMIDGEPCGPRLVKGGHFPFQREQWWICNSESEAVAASVKLAGYLAKQEDDLRKQRTQK